MIRHNKLICKIISLKNSPKKIVNMCTATFRPETEVCPNCHAQGMCIIHSYYSRHLISMQGGKQIDELVTIPRVVCTSCGTTHAILPDVIIPYCVYSLLFVLMVLAMYYLCPDTVEQICERFSITQNQLYKWVKLFQKHKREWLGVLKSEETSDGGFIRQLIRQDNYAEFSGGFFRLTNLSFLQSHRNPPNSRHRWLTTDCVRT